MAIQEARLLTHPGLKGEVVHLLGQLQPPVLATGSLTLQGSLHLTLARCLLTGLPGGQLGEAADRCSAHAPHLLGTQTQACAPRELSM